VAKDLISGVDLKALQDVGKAISTLPKEMNFHRLVRKIFD
jgi:2-oxoglutarate dehydrogenase complex dehydrogenase (E1) component-like enzyme